MPKFQIYLVEWKKYLKEKVKSYTCKESDGVENEVTGQKSCQVGTTSI